MEPTCVFCRVVAGDAQVSAVFEDEMTLAFMDLRQSNSGHVLVIPKAHVETLDLLPGTAAGALMTTVVAMTAAVRRAVRPDGISVWQSNGEAAGQEVPHVHFHVLPRWTGDDHLRVYPGRVPPTDRAKLDGLAHQIRAAIHSV